MRKNKHKINVHDKTIAEEIQLKTFPLYLNQDKTN